MKNTTVLFFVLILLLINGCTTGTVQYRFVPPAESGYSFTKASGVSGVADAETGVKKGKSSSFSVLNLVSVGNSGSATAARNGGVDIISTSQLDIVKLKLFGFPIFTQYTTTVTGN